MLRPAPAFPGSNHIRCEVQRGQRHIALEALGERLRALVPDVVVPLDYVPLSERESFPGLSQKAGGREKK